jgi:hypothetical protein
LQSGHRRVSPDGGRSLHLIDADQLVGVVLALDPPALHAA